VFDSWKKCKANLAEGLKRKLTPAQRKVRLVNGRKRKLAATVMAASKSY
jgi:tryptophanyl-tRNA synthetase